MYVRDFYCDFIEHMLLYMYICILTVLAKFYDMCNPEILCHCLFYLLFTCTLSEMMNKRCPINQSVIYFFLVIHVKSIFKRKSLFHRTFDTASCQVLLTYRYVYKLIWTKVTNMLSTCMCIWDTQVRSLKSYCSFNT